MKRAWYGNHACNLLGGIVASVSRIASAGLQGWRRKVADTVAQPLARRTALSSEQISAGLGALFFALSLTYVVKTVSAARRQLREG
jgi:hypothetical protein